MLNINKNSNISLKSEQPCEFSTVDNTKLLGTLWHSAWILKPEQPQWNGYTQSVHNGTNPEKAPILIFTTMVFVCELSHKCNCDPN